MPSEPCFLSGGNGIRYLPNKNRVYSFEASRKSEKASFPPTIEEGVWIASKNIKHLASMIIISYRLTDIYSLERIFRVLVRSIEHDTEPPGCNGIRRITTLDYCCLEFCLLLFYLTSCIVAVMELSIRLGMSIISVNKHQLVKHVPMHRCSYSRTFSIMKTKWNPPLVLCHS